MYNIIYMPLDAYKNYFHVYLRPFCFWCTKTGNQQPRSHVYLHSYDGLFRVSEPSDSKAADSHILPLRYAVEISWVTWKANAKAENEERIAVTWKVYQHHTCNTIGEIRFCQKGLRSYGFLTSTFPWISWIVWAKQNFPFCFIQFSWVSHVLACSISGTPSF